MAQTQTDAERKRLQRERTAKHRAKVKEQSAIDALANEQKRRDEFDAWRVAQRLVSPGEIEAFQNAEDCEAALTVAREYILALGQPDVQAGETLLDVERRVVSAWVEQGAPLLNRNTLRLDTSVASIADGYTFDFDTQWVPIDGANEVIDISTLPVIEVPALVEVPAADTPVIVEAAPTIEDTVAPTLEEQLAMEHRHQTGLCRVSPQEALMLKTQQDAMDEKSRKLSQANEARELANERRLGVAYVPGKGF
jgi:hypothetical protein